MFGIFRSSAFCGCILIKITIISCAAEKDSLTIRGSRESVGLYFHSVFPTGSFASSNNPSDGFALNGWGGGVFFQHKFVSMISGRISVDYQSIGVNVNRLSMYYASAFYQQGIPSGIWNMNTTSWQTNGIYLGPVFSFSCPNAGIDLAIMYGYLRASSPDITFTNQYLSDSYSTSSPAAHGGAFAYHLDLSGKVRICGPVWGTVHATLYSARVKQTVTQMEMFDGKLQTQDDTDYYRKINFYTIGFGLLWRI